MPACLRTRFVLNLSHDPIPGGNGPPRTMSTFIDRGGLPPFAYAHGQVYARPSHGEVNVKKVNATFFPPRARKRLVKKTERWLDHIRRKHPKLLEWSEKVIGDQDIYGGLTELSSKYEMPLSEILSRLEDWRRAYLPNIEVRAKLRAIGSAWKAVEEKASKALRESEPFIDPAVFKDRAIEVIRNTRFLSKLGLEAQSHRPLNEEIAGCKEDVKAFLKRRNVREVNEYGWLLLRAVFQEKWQAGTGKNQIAAFRKIPPTLAGRIKTREDALAVMKKAQVDVTRMEIEARRKEKRE